MRIIFDECANYVTEASRKRTYEIGSLINMNKYRISKTALALSFSVVSSSVFAGNVAPVQAPAATLPNPVAVASGSDVSLAFPGTFGIASAVAPVSGSGFVGANYVNLRDGVKGAEGDGSVSAGYSLGNPISGVSVTLSASVTGTDPFGDAGSFSLSASRLLRAGGSSATFVGASSSNLAAWGAGSSEEQFSVYTSHLVGFQAGGVEVPLQLVVGYGTSNTRNAADVLEDGAFAGVGIGMTQNISGSISFTETQVNTGFNVSIPNTSASVTVGVYDVTDNTDRQQFSLSVGYGF